MTPPSVILIVDDVEANRELLVDLLHGPQYVLLEASDGTEALRVAAETPPDLILLDVMMPGLDGYEVCRRVRASEHLAEIPVIMLTALDDHETRLAGINAGADDFITKPFNRAEMRARVRTITRLNRYRRLLEEAKKVHESEERLRLVMKTSLDAVVTLDAEGCVLTWNPAAEATFGWSQEEVVGRRLSRLVLPPRPREAPEPVTHRSITGEVGRAINRRIETTAVRKTGEEFPVEIAVTPATAGSNVLYAAFVRDITERRVAEEALRNLVIEKEALLKEVHHRVKNNLQVITSLLRLEAGRSKDEAARSAMGVMQGRVLTMATLHETLYRSGVYAAVDLGAYLTQLARTSFRAELKTSGLLHLSLDMADPRVGMDQALPCGLILNELLSNALRHAFLDGSEGEVKVELRPTESAGEIRLSVSDTGQGLPPDFESRRSDSLGLQLVSDLARQLGGTLSVASGPRGGTAVSVAFKADLAAGTEA